MIRLASNIEPINEAEEEVSEDDWIYLDHLPYDTQGGLLSINNYEIEFLTATFGIPWSPWSIIECNQSCTIPKLQIYKAKLFDACKPFNQTLSSDSIVLVSRGTW